MHLGMMDVSAHCTYLDTQNSAKVNKNMITIPSANVMANTAFQPDIDPGRLITRTGGSTTTARVVSFLIRSSASPLRLAAAADTRLDCNHVAVFAACMVYLGV